MLFWVPARRRKQVDAGDCGWGIYTKGWRKGILKEVILPTKISDVSDARDASLCISTRTLMDNRSYYTEHFRRKWSAMFPF